MKLNPAFVFSLVALLTASLLPAEPFTYQGRLENSGAPFTGTASIRLGLYLVASGGIPFRTETFPGVTVTDGIFTVKATSMVAGDFTGATRYLGIEVSSDDGATWTPLLPRQEVTWSPMAMHAKIAETVAGSVAASQLTGTLSPSLLGTGSVGGSVTFNPATGPPFSVSSTTKITNLNSDLLDGFDSGVFLQKTGGTMTGDLLLSPPAELSFGNLTRQMLNLYNADYGIGIQANTLYQRSVSRFSWFTGGTHSDTENTPGVGGNRLATLTSGGLYLRPVTADSGAMLAIGDSNFNTGVPYVYLREPVGEDDVLELSGSKVRITTQNPGTSPSISFGQTTGQHLVLYEGGGDTYGIGVQGFNEYFRTGDSFAWYRDGTHSDTAGNSGGGSTLMTLSSLGEVDVKGTSCGYAFLNRDAQSKRWEMYSRNSGGTNQMAFYSSDTGDVAALSPNGDMYLVGALSTTVLTIRGGADVAEPFATTQPAELEPGTVVVIDEDHAGKLKLSTAAYDTKVAGIISGAGGVKPGLRLQQDGVMEGDHHVALSGRVYVKADASTGGIRPGDLLTTSATPGHAMKVTDLGKAQGAILGKAMTALEAGTGLVLVLVTLQ
jgi:hypothetical protein